MFKELILDWYESNTFVLNMNTEGLSHEDSLLQPPQVEANCLNWVVGHILANRNLALRLLGWQPLWSDEVVARYQRGSEAVGAGSMDALPFSILLADLVRSQEVLATALAQAAPEILEAPYSEKQTVGQRLMGLAWHEAYHAGQTDYLRRLAGKTEGGVR